MKKCVIEASFTFDAGPPIIGLKYAFYKQYLGCDRLIDMDGKLYKYLGYNLDSYHHLLYLAGGMTFSYPLTSELPFNIIPFEDLYSVELLVSIMYMDDYTDELKKATENMGLDYRVCSDNLSKFIEFIKHIANELRDYDQVYICCEKPAAVFSSVLMMHFLKIQNNECKGVIIGKHATTPVVKNLLDKLGIFNAVMNEDFLVKAELDEMDAYRHLSVDDFELDCYPEKRGMRNISYSICRACPYKCNFCSISMNWDGNRIYRNALSECKTVEQVKVDLGRVKEVFGVSFISFCDCTMNYVAENPELFKVLKEINMLYACTSRADIVTDEFCNKLVSSNFVSVIVGVESLNPMTIKLMGKGGANYVEMAIDNCKRLYASGLDVQLNSLICYPYQTYDDVKEDLKQWDIFTDDMRKSGITVQKIPVGTLTLNYPSKMYFDVINDFRFEKKYHNITSMEVPHEVRNVVETIPYYAIDTQKEMYKNINKIDFVKQIYGLWDNDLNFLDSNLFDRLIQNIDVFIEVWETKNSIFTIECGNIDEKLFCNQELAGIIENIGSKPSNFAEISTRMFEERATDIRDTAQMILLLSIMGILKIY